MCFRGPDRTFHLWFREVVAAHRIYRNGHHGDGSAYCSATSITSRPLY
jgi:hypothetical protein